MHSFLYFSNAFFRISLFSRRVLGGLMLLVYLKHPHLLDEAPGLGDLKATPPRREEYVSSGSGNDALP